MTKKVKTYSWRGLTDILSTLSEKEVKALIDEELVGEQRPTILLRLHQRYTMVRAARERAELMEQIK